jgi:hypothetical protein
MVPEAGPYTLASTEHPGRHTVSNTHSNKGAASSMALDNATRLLYHSMVPSSLFSISSYGESP